MTSLNYRGVVGQATSRQGGQYGRVTRSDAAGLDPARDVPAHPSSRIWQRCGDWPQYYHQRPDTLSEAQVQAYVRYLIEQRQLAPSSVRVAVMGLRFFYTQTLHRPWTNLPLPKRTKTLPEVLSREEVARLLASTTTVRERALLMTTYGGGLRVSEVVRLRVERY